MRILTIGKACVILSIVSGCSLSGRHPAALVEARAAHKNADWQDIQIHAPSHLDEARAKLNAAEAAFEENDREKASRLARQATINLRLAEAQSDLKKTEQDFTELRQGIRTLKREMNIQR